MMIRWGIYLAFVVLMVYESVIYENVAVSMLMGCGYFFAGYFTGIVGCRPKKNKYHHENTGSRGRKK